LDNRVADHSHGQNMCYKRTGHVAFSLTEAHKKNTCIEEQLDGTQLNAGV